jgi:hypothetical protein
VLNILKKNVRIRRGKNDVSRSCEVIHQGSYEEASSTASVNNDWKHWWSCRVANEWLWMMLGRRESHQH